VGINVGPSQDLPANGAIRIAFDRQLHPFTVTRQSFVVRTARGGIAANPVVVYDPVARTVALSSPDPAQSTWLEPGQFYTLTLGIPSGEEDLNGVRAVDWATLDPSMPPDQQVIGFTVSAPTTAPGEPTMQFCDDVFPLFRAKCSQGTCHGAPTARSKALPASSLVLGSAEGTQRTAIGRVAQGANTGPRVGVAQSPQRIFGLDMPIVDPGSPGNSWLMYKMLLAIPRPAPANPATCSNGVQDSDEDDVDCGGPCAECTFTCDAIARPQVVPPAPVNAVPLSEEERARLSDFVLGREMPYPSRPAAPLGSDPNSLTVDELQRVRLWIAQGARVEECGCEN
jgi:hypothetical protein